MYSCYTDIMITFKDICAEKVLGKLTEVFNKGRTIKEFLENSIGISFKNAEDPEYQGVIYDIHTYNNLIYISIYTEHRPLVAMWEDVIRNFCDSDFYILFVSENDDTKEYWTNRPDYIDNYVVSNGKGSNDYSPTEFSKMMSSFFETNGICPEYMDSESLYEEAQYLDLNISVHKYQWAEVGELK